MSWTADEAWCWLCAQGWHCESMQHQAGALGFLGIPEMRATHPVRAAFWCNIMVEPLHHSQARFLCVGLHAATCTLALGGDGIHDWGGVRAI